MMPYNLTLCVQIKFQQTIHLHMKFSRDSIPGNNYPYYNKFQPEREPKLIPALIYRNTSYTGMYLTPVSYRIVFKYF